MKRHFFICYNVGKINNLKVDGVGSKRTPLAIRD